MNKEDQLRSASLVADMTLVDKLGFSEYQANYRTVEDVDGFA